MKQENVDEKIKCINFRYLTEFQKNSGGKIDIYRKLNPKSTKKGMFYPNIDIVYAVGDLLILKDGDEFMMFYKGVGNFDRIFDICSIEQTNESCPSWIVRFVVDNAGELEMYEAVTKVVINSRLYKADNAHQVGVSETPRMIG